MTDDTRNALNLLYHYTFKTGNTSRLTGPSNRPYRKAILEALLCSEVKSSECGINRLEDALFAAAEIQPDCPAVKRKKLAELACHIANIHQKETP